MDCYMIEVPSFWTKDDLLDLKVFLEQSPVGSIPVWIRVHGAEKSTKFSIASTEALVVWIQER